MIGRPETPMTDRFWQKVAKADGCWNWTAATFSDGYGALKRKDGKQIKAHRYSYEIHFGDIPGNLCVCHACDNPRCVNPAHLWLGTNRENTADKTRKGRAVRLAGKLNPMHRENRQRRALSNLGLNLQRKPA